MRIPTYLVGFIMIAVFAVALIKGAPSVFAKPVLHQNCAISSMALDESDNDFSKLTTSCGNFEMNRSLAGSAAVGGHYDLQVKGNRVVKVTATTGTVSHN